MKKYIKIIICLLLVILFVNIVEAKMLSKNNDFVIEKKYYHNKLNEHFSNVENVKEYYRYLDEYRDSIIEVATNEVGTYGGDKYSYWLDGVHHDGWCAVFASWCMGQVGYLDDENMFATASAPIMEDYFKENNQWLDASITPKPGMIIFFDLSTIYDYSHQDGRTDHVGIVEKVEDGVVYTIEGNYNNQCCRAQYSLDDRYILGYGDGNYRKAIQRYTDEVLGDIENKKDIITQFS